MERQYRNFKIECRKDENENKNYIVEGYATTFNESYNMGENDEVRLLEQVDSKAFDNATMDDVIFQYDHEGRVFARMSNNTLKLEKDERGLKVIADLSGTEGARSLYEDIKGGYVTKMSFAFTVTGDDEKRSKSEDGKTEFLRTITKIGRVFDVSAVSIPANDKTEIFARKQLEEVSKRMIEEKQAEEQKAKETEERIKKENQERERLLLELSMSL